MLPIIRLSQAWFDSHGWSFAEGTELLELDTASAVPAGAGDACPNPKCGRPNTEYQSWGFEPDPKTVNAEHERGRAYVRCVCGTVYSYAAVDVLDAPTEEARVRAASVSLTPATGSLQIDGQPVPPLVVEEITVTDEVAVVIAPKPGTAEEPAAVLPVTPSPPWPVGQQSFDVPMCHTWHPAYLMPPSNAATIWAAVEQQRHNIAARTAHLRHNQAND